jgi:dockerin type I repeat protein
MKMMYYFTYTRKFPSFLKTLILLIAAFAGNTIQAQIGCTVACPPMDPPTQVSLSQNCVDTLTPELLGLVASDSCIGPFEVDLQNSQGDMIGNIIDGTMIGETFLAMITSDADGGQGCMFNITVVDKFPPLITCPEDVRVPCPTSLDSIPLLTEDDVTECNDFVINYVDVLVFDGDCSDTVVSKFVRYYTVIDEYNNIATCTQMISLLKVNLGDIEFPPDLKGDDALICYPPPDTTPANTGYPTVDGHPVINGIICNILTSYVDQKAIICSGSYKLIRTWTIMDWCTNTSTQTVQIIEIRDVTGPTVEVDDSMSVAAGPGCQADVWLPAADISEDCSTSWTVRMQGPWGTVESNGGHFTDIPAGIYQIIYIATNDCGLEGRDTLVLDISDTSTPSAICHQSVSVPLNTAGVTIAPAEAFDAASYDNCEPVYFKAKRMAAPNGYNCFANGNLFYRFDDVVKFCCEDVDAGEIMVILRVYDIPVVPGIVSDNYLAGHFTDCMVSVDVQDKIGPTIVCPSDLTISCEYDFDPDNLSVFGKIVDDPADREDICIDDPGDDVQGPNCMGLDGLATDNCSVVIEETAAVILDSLCGTGQIIRTFKATDPGGRSVSCQQVITIVNYHPFTSDNIEWPLDYETSQVCDINALDPEDLPYPYSQPTLTTDQCDLATFNYSDEVYDFSGSSAACFKIIRTWTVLDWCQFSATGGQSGRWTHFQVIKVKNTIPPTFISSGPDMDLCSDDPGCGDAIAQLEASADDDCTDPNTFRWRISIDLYYNGSFDDFIVPNIGQSVSESYSFPIGTHRVLYAVQDFCSNTTVEEQFITVESCAPPSAKCQDITTTLMPVDPDGGMITIWASDLDAGSDHICGLDVSVAFSSDPTDINRVFDCDDLGDNAVELWVIDENGLTDFCIVTVTIQDNNTVCPPGGGGVTGTISGSISSSSTLEMSDVLVELEGSNAPPEYTEEGEYAFPAMPLGGSYVVQPELNTEHRNGVSTIDLIQIQKHLLGIKSLDSPYRIIAADANKSGSVSAVDILELKKLILGIYDELPNNSSWRFIDKNYVFINPDNPFAEEFAESYIINPLNTDMIDVDFVGIKIGDVNESAQVLQGSTDENDMNGLNAESALHLDDIRMQAGEIREFELTAESLNEIATTQFTLEWDRTRIDVMSVEPGPRANRDQWSEAELNTGKLPLSWHKLEMPYVETDVLITLTIRAIRRGQLSEALSMSSVVTTEETMTESGIVTKPYLVFGKSHGANNNGFVLHQNMPNPFSQETTIPFDIEQPGTAELMIYDVLGRILYTVEHEAIAGYNEILVPASALSATGLVMYTLRANDTQQTKRMIIEKE